MPRLLMDENAVHPAIREAISNHHIGVVREVIAAIQLYPIVVVGMAGNPVVRKACKLLETADFSYHYLEFGSYFSQWRRRNVLKMWSGWPTFPMVFIGGILVGGADNLRQLIHSGELKNLLKN